MKLNATRRAQEFRDAESMEHLREATGNEQRKSKRVALRGATTSNIIGVGLSKPVGVFILLVLCTDARHRITGFNVCYAGFQSRFGPILFYPPISHFWNKSAILCHCMSTVSNFPRDFYTDSQLTVCFES